MTTLRLIFIALIFSLFGTASAFAERDCSYYGDCEEYRGRYGGSGSYGDERYEDYRRDRMKEEERLDDRYEREKDAAARAAQKQAEQQTVKPSCPEGTKFDGKHCIQPEGQRRKGGKGTINPCPQGMHISGDNCVK